MSTTTPRTKSNNAAQDQSDRLNTTAPTLRPLAPKPAENIPIRGGRGAAQVRQSDRCSTCFKRNCTLLSHRMYNTQTAKNRSRSTSRPPIPPRDRVFDASYASQLASRYIDKSLATNKIDPFFELPLPTELQGSEAQMHELFHEWFTNRATLHYDRYRPRDVVGDVLHGPFVAPALMDPVLCLSILSVSAMCQQGSETQAVSSVALNLLTLSTQKMRLRLTADVHQVSDNTIAASAYLWAATCYLDHDDRHSISDHGRSVLRLVDSRGGLNRLGMCGAISGVLRWSDLLTSLLSHRACWFEADMGEPVPRAYEYRQYGHAWRQMLAAEGTEVDREVVELCCRVTTCVAIFDEHITQGLRAVQYVAGRQRLAQTSAKISAVKAKYVGTDSIEECVCTALNVCNIVICAGCEVPSTSAILTRYCTRLSNMIKRTLASGLWQQNLDMLIWVMFTCTLVRRDAEQIAWGRQVITRAMEYRFGSRSAWSQQWREQLVTLLCRFTWSSACLDSHMADLSQALWTDS